MESISNYLIYCIQNIESLSYSDPFEKKSKIIAVNVPSYVDALLAPPSNESLQTQKLDYKSFGSFTKEIRKREGKYEEKKRELLDDLLQPSQPKARGRKPKIKILEE